MAAATDPIDMIAEDLARFYDDPLGFVMWAFPWGSGQLSDSKGPREWQKKALARIGEEVKARGFNGKEPVDPLQMAYSSGHGIGKSAFTAMLILWIISTRPFSKGVVTANTGDQLRTKTWAEVAKWHGMSLIKDFFEYKNTRGNMCLYAIDHPDTWRVDAMTCREESSEAFAGLHAATSTPYYIFDEGSAVPEKIWEVAHGGLTDGEPMWFVFGNPTRNTGSFRNAFGRYKHRWINQQIDSRTVEGTNKKLMQEWVDDFGEDSDFVRVRVRGLFPRSAVCQLIPGDLVTDALGKHLHASKYDFAPKVLGVDVAWYGDDRSCIFMRQGLRSSLIWQGREVDSITLAGLVAQFEDQHQTHATFIDAGMGNGVIDQLRHLGRKPIAVYFGGASTSDKYFNKRAQMWGEMAEWLKLGPALPDEQDLFEDLTGPEYQMTMKGQIQLERKEAMKKRGLSSPDLADALALTFAAPVSVPDPLDMLRVKGRRRVCNTEYDRFG